MTRTAKPFHRTCTPSPTRPSTCPSSRPTTWTSTPPNTPATPPTTQYKEPNKPAPTFGPSRKLDIEAEVGFVVGTPTEYGRQVALDQFPDHVFGVCLVNDWSARDLQAWEYVPLGPF